MFKFYVMFNHFFKKIKIELRAELSTWSHKTLTFIVILYISFAKLIIFYYNSCYNSLKRKKKLYLDIFPQFFH